MITTDKNREDNLRRKLSQRGYTLHKDRAKIRNIDHQGGYMIINLYRQVLVAGQRHDLNLDDVERFVDEH
jgi:hypothetical protein